MATPSQVLDAAMELNPQERAEVVHKLLLSLEPPGADEDAEQEWVAEVRRRLQAIRDGRTVLRDWDEALLEIRRSVASRGAHETAD
jgi:putative addiction module component (TIGR02574 family)